MKAALRMRRLALVGCVAALGACAARTPPPLYLWETFPRQQYEALQRSGGAGAADQILAMQEHADKARAEGAALPPGFRAHLGLLQLSAGNAEQARSMWLAEKQAFPESSPYMDQLLKRLGAPGAAPAKTTENPA